MSIPTTREPNHHKIEQRLFLALELSNSNWKLAFTTGLAQKPRIRDIPSGDLPRLMKEIESARHRFGLAETVPVLSCYEAGRDGFWIHRALESEGIQNQVWARRASK